MSRTRKPCPGCGNIDDRRKADDICSDCRRALGAAKAIIAEAGRQREREHVLRKYLRHGGWYDSDAPIDMDAHAELRRAFDDVVMTVHNPETVPIIPNSSDAVFRRELQVGDDRNKDLVPSLMDRKKGREDGESYYGTLIRLYPEQAVALNRLDAAIRGVLDAVYRDAMDAGKDLLHQMATGKISVADFNEAEGLGPPGLRRRARPRRRTAT